MRQLREPNAAVAFVELELEPELEVPDLAAASPSMSNIRVALLPVEMHDDVLTGLRDAAPQASWWNSSLLR